MQMEKQTLNWQDGVARVVNNKALYAKLLGRFVDTQSDAASAIAAALDAGNMDDARMLAHTLKGTAANLGAEALAEAARRLEDAVTGGGDPAAGVTALRQTLDETLAAMRNFQP